MGLVLGDGALQFLAPATLATFPGGIESVHIGSGELVKVDVPFVVGPLPQLPGESPILAHGCRAGFPGGAGSQVCRQTVSNGNTFRGAWRPRWNGRNLRNVSSLRGV